MTKSLVVITGAGSGLGAALTAQAVAGGDHVLGVVRHQTRCNDLATLLENRALHLLELDLNRTDCGEILHNKLAAMLDNGFSLKALVFNAGEYHGSVIEEHPLENAERLFDTNFFCILRCVQALLPLMRERKEGQLWAVSSLSAHIGLAADGLYAASKAALERMFESLQLELEPLGINVGLLVPRGFESRLFERRDSSGLTLSGDNAQKPERSSREGQPVMELAARLLDLIDASANELRYPGDNQAAAILGQLYVDYGIERLRLAKQWSNIT